MGLKREMIPTMEEEKKQESHEERIDARKATYLVREYFENIHKDWMLMFRVERVEENTSPNVWKVTCSFFTSPGQSKPLKYLVKVNVSNRDMVDVIELKE